MVAGNGDAEHGGGTGATPLEERVRRLEKDVEELREQVRTHTQAPDASADYRRDAIRGTCGNPRRLLARQRLPPQSALRNGKSSPPLRRSHPAIPCGAGAETPERGDRSSGCSPPRTAVRDVVGGESWRRPASRGGVLPLADGRRARMAHASRARGRRRGHWRRALCLRAACQNLPSRLLATARGRRCRGVLPFRLRRVERVATRALRGGICLLRASPPRSHSRRRCV